MSIPARRGGTPVWERGRAGRLLFGLLDHARTAWWGIVSPRITESQPLEIAQAVILRPAAATSAGVGEEVLLSVRHDLFGWELPGGTPLPGESLASALVREVGEETGFDVEIEAEVGRFRRQGFRPHTAIVFRCRVVGGREQPSDETPRLGWFPAAAPPANLFPWYREPLACALRRGVAPVSVEEWQGVAAILSGLRIDLALRWRGLD